LRFFSKYRKGDPLKAEGRREKEMFIKFALDNYIEMKEVTGSKGNSYEELNGSIDLT